MVKSFCVYFVSIRIAPDFSLVNKEICTFLSLLLPPCPLKLMGRGTEVFFLLCHQTEVWCYSNQQHRIIYRRKFFEFKNINMKNFASLRLSGL